MLPLRAAECFSHRPLGDVRQGRAGGPRVMAERRDDIGLAAVRPRIPTEEEYQATYQRLLAAHNKKRGQ